MNLKIESILCNDCRDKLHLLDPTRVCVCSLTRSIHIIIQSDCIFPASHELVKTSHDTRRAITNAIQEISTLFYIRSSRVHFTVLSRFIRALINHYVDDPRRETLRTTLAYISR